MMYAYSFTLAQRAIVTTFDHSAKNLQLLSTHHWLSDPKNVLVLRLAAPAWVSIGGIVPPMVQQLSGAGKGMTGTTLML